MINFVRSRLLVIGLSAASAVAGLIAVLLLELAVVGWQRSSLKKLFQPSASFRRDLISYCLDVTGILAIAGNLAALGSALYFGHWVRDHLGLNLLHSIPSIVGQNLVLIFSLGLFDYWMHRLMHKIPWMWEIHKYHHSATEMSIFTARRDSFLVVPIATFFRVIPFTILGTPAEYPYFAALISAHAMLIHSEIDWDFGWLGRWLIISPHDHRVHHSMDEKHLDKNFAFFLPFWDQLFGTFHNERDTVTAIGVGDDIYNEQPYLKGMAINVKAAFLKMLSP